MKYSESKLVTLTYSLLYGSDIESFVIHGVRVFDQVIRIHVSIKHFNKAGVYVFIHCFKCSYIKSEFPKIHAT